MSFLNSRLVMIYKSLYESSLPNAISLYLIGTLLDVLLKDHLIESMIQSSIIHTLDVINTYNNGLIPSVCLIYLNYLFIVRRNISNKGSSSSDTHSVRCETPICTSPLEPVSNERQTSSKPMHIDMPCCNSSDYPYDNDSDNIQSPPFSETFHPPNTSSSDLYHVKPVNTVLSNKNNNSLDISNHELLISPIDSLLLLI